MFNLFNSNSIHAMAIFAPAGELFIFDTKWKLNHIPENMVQGRGALRHVANFKQQQTYFEFTSSINLSNLFLWYSWPDTKEEDVHYLETNPDAN